MTKEEELEKKLSSEIAQNNKEYSNIDYFEENKEAIDNVLDLPTREEILEKYRVIGKNRQANGYQVLEEIEELPDFMYLMEKAFLPEHRARGTRDMLSEEIISEYWILGNLRSIFERLKYFGEDLLKTGMDADEIFDFLKHTDINKLENHPELFSKNKNSFFLNIFHNKIFKDLISKNLDKYALLKNYININFEDLDKGLRVIKYALDLDFNILKKLLILLKKNQLDIKSQENLKHLDMLSYLIPNHSTKQDLNSDLSKKMLDVKVSINSILGSDVSGRSLLGRNKQETYELIEVLYENFGSYLFENDYELLDNILKTTCNKKSITNKFINKYNLKGRKGAEFLSLFFIGFSDLSVYENYRVLEEKVPAIFSYEVLIDLLNQENAKHFKNIFLSPPNNFVYIFNKYKTEILADFDGFLESIKNHLLPSGSQGEGLENLKNVDDIFGFDVSYEEFLKFNGVFIIGKNLENQFLYLKERFPDSIKSLNDLNKFSPFYRNITLSKKSVSYEKALIEALEFSEEDFLDEDIMSGLNTSLEWSIEGTLLDNLQELVSIFGKELIFKYLGKKDNVYGALDIKDKIVRLGSNIGELLVLIGESEKENKYLILERLLDNIYNHFGDSEFTKTHIEKTIKLINILGLKNIYDPFLINFILTETEEEENELLEVYNAIFNNNLKIANNSTAKGLLNKNIKDIIYEIRRYKKATINNINKENIDKIVFKHYFINSLNDENSNIYDLTKEKGYFNFPINSENFLDFFDDNEVILKFEKDKGVVFEGEPIPWTKAWFLEKPKRKTYLSYNTLFTFRKFGTIIGLGQIEGITDTKNFSNYYTSIIKTISLENSRSAILQLGEIFNLALKNEKYDLFDELVDNKVNIGKNFQEFIEKYYISDKGRTVLSLLITREIRNSFNIFKDSSGKDIVDFVSIKNLLLNIFYKFEKYKEVIELYDNPLIKTSIGMEYEVTNGIADGYYNETKSDYKNDIETISEYAGISKGYDAVHEIATKPTNNPYLLILEIQLLQDLDFLDLNFKKEDYLKGSRGLHLTLGSEQGIELDENANFIQNILIAGNLGGINAGKKIKNVNDYSNIREKGHDCELVFGNEKTECVEFRSLSIDKAEQFERLVLSLFNLNMLNQYYNKFLELQSNTGKYIMSFDSKTNFINEFYELYGKNIDLNPNIIYSYFVFKNDISQLIEEHNKNFIKNEVIDIENLNGLAEIINIFNCNSPFVKLLYSNNMTIDTLKQAFENEINSKGDFKEFLKTNGNVTGLSIRQFDIIYETYNLKLKKAFKNLKENNFDLYENILEVLNQDFEDILRKITNYKRFKEVISKEFKGIPLENLEYIKQLKINSDEFNKIITPELINKFTMINNLFVKEDSINALSMLDTTKELDGKLISDSRLTEMTIFDRLDRGKDTRNGYNIIQGASKKMLTQAIQKRILEFNQEIFGFLKEKTTKN